jgi:hypothetical protein
MGEPVIPGTETDTWTLWMRFTPAEQVQPEDRYRPGRVRRNQW